MTGATELSDGPAGASDIQRLAQSPAERLVSWHSRAGQDAAKVGIQNVGWLSHRNDSPLQRVHALRRLHTSCILTAEQLHILNSGEQERQSRRLALVHGATVLQKY